MVQEIYIIDDKPELKEILKTIFKNEKGYRFTSVTTKDLDVALKNIPSLIIINEDNYRDYAIKKVSKGGSGNDKWSHNYRNVPKNKTR